MRVGFGIDFGTTNSVAARFDPASQTCEAATWGASQRPHPSFAWYRPSTDPVFGMKAREEHSAYAEQPGHEFHHSMKRKLGKPAVGGRGHPEVIADYLRFIRSHAERDWGFDPSHAVLTIPVHFGGAQRRQLRLAAEEAGIKVRSFVHEPFAAIVGQLVTGEGRLGLPEGPLVVFDWGGGTLDVTVALVEGGRITELAVDGLRDLAGEQIDDRVRRAAVASWQQEEDLSPDEAAPLPVSRSRLLIECENRKIDLSDRDSVDIALSDLSVASGGVLDLQTTLNRTQLEGLIEGDVAQGIAALIDALDKAHIKASEVTVAFAIGGTTRIPLVRTRLRDIFGSRLRHLAKADTIIAEGAAVIDGLELSPVLSHDIGVELADGEFYPVMRAGEPIAGGARAYELGMHCTDNRDGSAHLIVGDKRNSKWSRQEVLRIPVSQVPWRPHYEERITVNLWIDDDFILRMSGRSMSSTVVAESEWLGVCFGLEIPEEFRA